LPVLKFTKFITINFRYLDQEINNFDENKTVIRYFDRLDQKWVEMDTNRNLDSNTLSINTDHLTLFAITAPTTTKTSIISQNTTNNNQNTGTPFWQTLLISLIILTLLGFGIWYVYTNYLHDYLDSIKPQEQSIFGGSADTESKSTPPPKPTSITPSNPTPTSSASQSKTPPKTNPDDKKSDDDQEIWINF
jgi:cytoskeletal protein RodZ